MCVAFVPIWLTIFPTSPLGHFAPFSTRCFGAHRRDQQQRCWRTGSMKATHTPHARTAEVASGLSCRIHSHKVRDEKTCQYALDECT